MKTFPWTDGGHQSWRWKTHIAIILVKTFDSGWVWMKRVWRWQYISGWGFNDDFSYRYPESRGIYYRIPEMPAPRAIPQSQTA